MNSQNTVLLKHARSLMCVVCADPMFTNRRSAKERLASVLEEYGFSGIWSASSFRVSKEYEKKCMNLTDKLIEVSFFL